MWRGGENKINVRWINSKIGYGVFAKVDIKKNEIIGEYTGVIENLSQGFLFI